MGKKGAGGNSKAEAANAKKAAAKAEKDKSKAVAAEAQEADKWSQGAKGKGKKDAEAEKKAAQAAKKAELARIKAEEEKETAKIKPKGADKAAAKKAAKVDAAGHARRTIPEFSASNIDDALDLLTLSDDKKGPVSNKDIERHPERRFKAALAAYEERELPRFKKENPGLRLSQLKEIIFKEFKKSPENPFNQANIMSYNATSEDARSLKDQRRDEVENRLRTA
ncbi:hypothetical protein BDB00DRAFT_852771 [Zychaea mexicana]|uniref:uncharacterized protein n=1 Tax=Zychaea mexicana TaxID=64656 RepID=UPI0022FF0311|nr:uncharacterized protein BDB00DRAFT_852771 [Zychaea mexicana]KAI9484906.1 hypothetical protein BDB00DRAFT_852771 [Zychaea mexicana]